MVTSLYKYRSFIVRNALADVRHRYAGTGMGVVWNVVHPLAMIAIYSVLFTSIFARPADDEHGLFYFPMYMCAGFLPWIAFSECLTRGCGAFSANAAYLKKLPIPEQVFVAQSAVSATLSLGISFALLLGVALVLREQPPTWYWLLLPIPLVLLQTVGFGLGLWLGTINVFFSDVGQLLTIALQVLFWMTPIVIPWEYVPDFLRPVLALHPVTPAIETVRALFLRGELPALWVWPAMAAWAVGALVLGWVFLRVLRDEIRDNL